MPYDLIMQKNKISDLKIDIPRQPPKQPLISTVELSKLIEFILILHFEFVYLSSTHPSDIQAK